MEKTILYNNLRQILNAVLAGSIMMGAGFIWMRFGTGLTFFNPTFSSFLNVLAFKNEFILVIEMIVFLSAICLILFMCEINRFLILIIFFLIFPMIWLLVTGTVFYAGELIHGIDRYDLSFSSLSYIILYFGGLIIIPALITTFYYKKKYSSKIIEIATLNVIYISMNLWFYSLLSFLTIGCFYFRQCI